MISEQTAKLPFNPLKNWTETSRSALRESALEMEVERLLEDVRKSLGQDLGAATRAAGSLVTLLDARLSEIPRPPPSRGGLAPWQKRKVQDYIDCTLDAPIFVGDLAKLASLSSSHFCRAFKESFGFSPYAYIIRLRVERAKELMLTTSEPLCQIAAACGLADQAHLTRRFREATGTTPGVWRRAHLTEREQRLVTEYPSEVDMLRVGEA
jgi:AraC family transcriptional regulator